MDEGPAPERRQLSPVLRLLLHVQVWFAERIRVGERQAILLWAALIGVIGGLASEAFRQTSGMIHLLATGSSEGVISSFESLAPWQRLTIPIIGGALAGLTLYLGQRAFSRARQKNTTDYMEAVVIGDGTVSAQASLIKIFSSLFSISLGASIGREGPMVQLSSLLASLCARFRRFPIPQRRHLVACGAAAGIASAYNAPIAGAFFVAEIVLGTVVVESLGPLIMSSVVATFTIHAFHGSGPLYRSPDLDLHSQWEIIPLCLIGVVLGLLAPFYLKFLRLVERWFARLRWIPPLKLAMGGAIVGGIAISLPEVCGNGQSLLISLLHQNWEFSWVLLLVFAKLFATSATFGSGAVGGIFTPTLFTGTAIGILYGQTVLLIAPGLRADPTIYGLVGMGAFLAATTGAPLMAILMVFELTLSYGIVPFLMIACVTGYYCSSIFERKFMYGESLERKGAAFFNSQLAALSVQDLIKAEPLSLLDNATFAEIASTFVQHRFQHIYIVNRERQLLGAISLHDVKAFLDRPELETVIIAADIMNEHFPRISPLQGLGEALKKFSESPADRLPVVENLTNQRLIGTISKTDIILHLAGEQSRATAHVDNGVTTPA